MERLNRITEPSARLYPERIIQFGEGNFLRAFADWIIQQMNNKAGFDSGVVVVQPLPQGMADMLNEQDGLYHVNLQGIDKGQTVNSIERIDVITRVLNPYTDFDAYMQLAEQREMRFVISNTTEAGIAFDPACSFDDKPAASYPGKLTQLLYHRFIHFGGAMDKGLIIFPCELIFHNGRDLKNCIYKYIDIWELGEEFRCWFDEACGVYSTLVDRIVPGYPKDTIKDITDKIRCEDKLVVKAEIFYLWVIEAPLSVAREFPADNAGLNVLFVSSEKPYHDRKVTLLNGPHTVLSPVGFLCGLDTVGQCMNDPVVSLFVHRVMFDELMPTLDLPREALETFANDVTDRFRNPFVNHFLTSIMLNSFSKYKTRDLPGLKLYLQRKGFLPEGLVLGLAAIITYYKGDMRGETAVVPQDDPAVLDLLKSLWQMGSVRQVSEGVLGSTMIWGEDLNLIPGLTDLLTADLKSIREEGMLQTVRNLLKL